MKQRLQTSPAHTPSRRQDPFFKGVTGPGSGPAPPFFQPKLRVGEPGDRFELEADRVADEVVSRGVAPQVQTAVSPEGPPDEEVQRREAGHVPQRPAHEEGPELPPAGSGEGRPLPDVVRGEVEAAFGVSFSPVRIHTGESAAAMSDDLGANAFTHGRDIYFARGRFAPETREGRHLLAHELTHVVQQGGGAPANTVQADFAVEPPRPDAVPRALTPQEIADAITFNTRTLTEPAEIEMLREILGLDPAPAAVDADFIQVLVEYQALYNLTQDGKLGPLTRRRLSNEILAESGFLGFAGLGSLATGVALRGQIRALINAGNLTYATYRTRIRAATVLQRDVVLADIPTLRALRNHLPWDDFARCVELLGRRAPTFAFLIQQTVVRNALRAAWTASNPGVNPPVAGQHEEGGWVYLNLITNELSVRRQAAGAGASINLAAPPVVADNIVVAKFHTHPNLGPGWVAGPSQPSGGRPGDVGVDAAHGVPDIVVGNPGVNPAQFQFFPSGPDRRAHLAGNQGLPGAAGGLAPQGRMGGPTEESGDEQ